MELLNLNVRETIENLRSETNFLRSKLYTSRLGLKELQGNLEAKFCRWQENFLKFLCTGTLE